MSFPSLLFVVPKSTLHDSQQVSKVNEFSKFIKDKNDLRFSLYYQSHFQA